MQNGFQSQSIIESSSCLSMWWDYLAPIFYPAISRTQFVGTGLLTLSRSKSRVPRRIESLYQVTVEWP